MQIFGLEPVMAAILITVIGITLQNTLGWLKSTSKIQPRLLMASALIAFVVSVQLVIPIIENIPDDIEDMAKFQIIIAAIAAIAGIDAMGKNVGKAAIKGYLSKKKPSNDTEKVCHHANEEDDLETLSEEMPEEVPPARQ